MKELSELSELRTNIVAEIAYHSEKVKARKLSTQKNINFDEALHQVLGLFHPEDKQAWIGARQAQIQYLHDKQAQRKIQSKAKFIHKQHSHPLEKHKTPDTWQMWFDGSAQPNPGQCTVGVFLKSPQGEWFTESKACGYGDNIDAEYQALITALKMLAQFQESHHIQHLILCGDSLIVIEDVQKIKTIRTSDYEQWQKEAEQLLAKTRLKTKVDLHWVPREKNRMADRLTQYAQRAVSKK